MLVLENLLDDAKRMKERYEQDYLGEHKAVLGLKSQLEKIRSGKAEGDRWVARPRLASPSRRLNPSLPLFIFCSPQLRASHGSASAPERGRR